MLMTFPAIAAPDGYAFETFGFGEATPERLRSFVDLGLWDAIKSSSRMKRLLTEAAS